jgi:predicted Zn-dependent protease
MNRRKFLNYMGCSCCGIMMNACSTAPITDRRQLKIIPEAKLNAQAAQIYEKVKKKEKMSEDKKTLNEIKTIGKKIEDSISEYFLRSKMEDPTIGFNWEYILIDNDKVKNAWCMPGGKIAVYTGILDVTKNLNGLAAVMGHEIAHAVAKHSVERASRGMLLNTSTQLIDIISGGKLSQVNRVTGMNTVGLLSQIGIMNPFNRTQESEADYLGMIFSSLSGYDIRETKKLWERMRASKKGKEIAEFMSTHPSSKTRIRNLTQWENEIILDYPPIKFNS